MHRRLELDFQAGPYRPAWPGAALLALALVLALGLWLGYRDVQRELATLQETTGLVAQDTRAARPVNPARIDEQQKSVHFAMRQLALPWVPLIESLEQATTPDVAVLVLQPDGLQGVLRLTAEARNREAMFDYLRRLDGSATLAEVHLVSHQLQLDNPQRPVQFAVQGVFRSWR